MPDQSGLWIAVQLREAVQGDILQSNTIQAILNRSRENGRPQLEPLFQSLTERQIEQLIDRAAQLEPGYEAPKLSLWQQLESPIDVNPYELAAALRRLDQVETAYLMRPGEPPALNPLNDPLNSSQGYLDPAPLGIDGRYARSHGGTGKGIGFVDVEQGWNLNHEDLTAAAVASLSGVNHSYFPHGTRVLGVVLMSDNSVGGVGIAPLAQGGVVSQWRTSDRYNTPDAILYALSTMHVGDVLLLEVQEEDPVGATYYWPAEIADATYLVIRLATALQIAVVEAAGNGHWDLDAYHNLSGKAIFDHASPDFRDSGAILTGAATASPPHSQHRVSGVGTNYGSRVDCYAWGEKVVTTDTNSVGTDHTDYETGFGWTSAAAAIVAGAALIVQQLAVTARGAPLSPGQLRTMLADGGTPSADPAVDRIGVMPDLRAIIDNHALGAP